MPDDKFSTFMYMMRFPIKTVGEVAKIKADLGKVFDGQNPVFKYDFTSSDLEEDWMDFVTEKQLQNKWRTEGLEAMMLSINAVMIIDFPEEQDGERPEPYSWLLDICHAIDFEDEVDEMEWFQYRKDKHGFVANPDNKRLALIKYKQCGNFICDPSCIEPRHIGARL